MTVTITNPARQLPAFTAWHSLTSVGLPAPAPRCYVAGCGQADYGPVHHPLYGAVQTCAGHDPRPAEARTAPAAEASPQPAPSRPPDSQGNGPGGARVPLHPAPAGPSAPDAIDPSPLLPRDRSTVPPHVVELADRFRKQIEVF